MEPNNKKGHAGNALLIEDHEIYQEMMMTFLQELNYIVDLVVRDKRLVKKALDKEYNLIILDISNDELIKDEIISLIRESKNIGTPVIAWSELLGGKDQGSYVIWGADVGLLKPCRFIELKMAIGACFKSQRYERKYVYTVTSIAEKWKEYGQELKLLERIYHLSNGQLALLNDALQNLIEYKKIYQVTENQNL